jgi:hypothetical protein
MGLIPMPILVNISFNFTEVEKLFCAPLLQIVVVFVVKENRPVMSKFLFYFSKASFCTSSSKTLAIFSLTRLDFLSVDLYFTNWNC